MDQEAEIRLKILNERKKKLLEEYVNAEIESKLSKSLFKSSKVEAMREQINAINDLINESPAKLEK
jgi:hypothetical protein